MMSANEYAKPRGEIKSKCADFPEFKRLKYFYGQMLGAQDFQLEQNYFREKLKLHNRCLHGYGTVCGLMVIPEPEGDSCEPEGSAERQELKKTYERLKVERKQALRENDAQKASEIECQIDEVCQALEKYPTYRPEEPKRTKVRIECGFGLDCEGNELIVRRPLTIDLWHHLSRDDRKKVEDSGVTTLYLSICHCELPIEPMRPVVSDACGVVPECVPGKLLDTIRVRVTTECPDADGRCETCCVPCADPCLLLARIEDFKPGESLKPEQIHNEVRRLIDGSYPYTTITGISWTHGGEYNQKEAEAVLGCAGLDSEKKGLKVRFSRPVLVSTLTRGVVDLWVIQGGKTRSGDIYSLEGQFEGLPSSKKTTTEFRYRYTGDETLDPGDRVLIIIRTAFILDECCRPVDGAHVGGRVPIIEDEECAPYKKPAPCTDCPTPLPGYGPWTSGTGYPGANFESWFYITKSTTQSGKSSRVQE